MLELEITIAIILYNSEKYIRQTLLSALEQSFAMPYEILVVNNSCTDRSIEIVKEISETHSRGSFIRIYDEPSNLGPGPARNDAIAQAKGKYFFFLDSDDYISPDCLQILYPKAEETQADYTVGSHEWFEDETGNVLRKGYYKSQVIEHPAAGVYMFAEDIPMQIEMWNILFRTFFLRQHNIHYEHRIMEEYFFDLQLRAEASKVAIVDACTLHYRVHQNSVVTTFAAKATSDEEVRMFCDIINRMRQLIEEKFAAIPGIYDLYLCRVIWVFENLKRTSLTDTQWAYISEVIKDFLTIIPGVKAIKTLRRKFVYLFAGSENSVMRMSHALSYVNSPLGGRILWMLGKLGWR